MTKSSKMVREKRAMIDAVCLLHPIAMGGSPADDSRFRYFERQDATYGSLSYHFC